MAIPIKRVLRQHARHFCPRVPTLACPAFLTVAEIKRNIGTARGKVKSQTMTGLKLPNDYDTFLKGLKERVRAAQLRASLAVNRELVLLYWGIGRDILARQKEHGWGAKIIDRLAADLRQEFPEVTGFSPRNLKYMRAFAEAWPDEPIVQQLAAQIPWFHNLRHPGQSEESQRNESGISARPSRTAGVATFWFTRSRAASIIGKGRH